MLHLLIALMNSTSAKGGQSEIGLLGNSLRKLPLICQSWALLKDKCKAFYKSLILIQGWLLYFIILTAGSLHLLTQFIRDHGPLFLLTISCILRSKNDLFIFLTMFLNFFQSSMHFEALYLSRFLLQLLFHQLLDLLVILINLAYLFHRYSTELVIFRIMFSSKLTFEIFDMSSSLLWQPLSTKLNSNTASKSLS